MMICGGISVTMIKESVIQCEFGHWSVQLRYLIFIVGYRNNVCVKIKIIIDLLSFTS